MANRNDNERAKFELQSGNVGMRYVQSTASATPIGKLTRDDLESGKFDETGKVRISLTF